ncbi:Wzz/FepE/Etk N-terminal domain-containing protein [uncultured Cetobacterium sp.]|uniref:YveK family protein n=1 Tax=uncultured Cetobacterium sp. TaxID=527638 RepID=UPI002638FB49|nr:Wzz/FepE/Etk N-terminal domain-containing protein [uncultured Cetobacterium sp.]
MRKKEDFYEDDFYEDEEELDLMDLVFTLLRRWKLIMLVAIPIFALGVFFAATRPTVYKGELTLMVSSGRNYSANSLDGGELSMNQKLATTYAEIAKSRAILNNVIKKYDLDESLKELQEKVTIEPVEDTELLQLTYKNGDPLMAAAVVNEIGNEFMLKVREVMNFQNIKIVEPAEVPKEPLPKKRALILAISFVLSGMIGCMVAFIVEFFFCKLRKPKDIEKILGTTMLGMVPDFNLSLVEEGKNGK